MHISQPNQKKVLAITSIRIPKASCHCRQPQLDLPGCHRYALLRTYSYASPPPHHSSWAWSFSALCGAWESLVHSNKILTNRNCQKKEEDCYSSNMILNVDLGNHRMRLFVKDIMCSASGDTSTLTLSKVPARGIWKGIRSAVRSALIS